MPPPPPPANLRRHLVLQEAAAASAASRCPRAAADDDHPGAAAVLTPSGGRDGGCDEEKQDDDGEGQARCHRAVYSRRETAAASLLHQPRLSDDKASLGASGADSSGVMVLIAQRLDLTAALELPRPLAA